MSEPFVVSLPIADRQVAFDFYGTGLGLTPVGPIGGDGLPEPLQFELGTGGRIMLVPTGGFDWAIGDHTMRSSGVIGCLLNVGAASDAEVDEIVGRAVDAGATVIVEPQQLPWGMYAATFTDPDGNLWMATSAPAPT